MKFVLARQSSALKVQSSSVDTIDSRSPSAASIIFHVVTALWYTFVILPESHLSLHSELHRPSPSKTPSKSSKQKSSQPHWKQVARKNVLIGSSILQLASFPLSLIFLSMRRIRLARLSALVAYCNAMSAAVLLVGGAEVAGGIFWTFRSAVAGVKRIPGRLGNIFSRLRNGKKMD